LDEVLSDATCYDPDCPIIVAGDLNMDASKAAVALQLAKAKSEMQWCPLAPLPLPHAVCWNGAPGLLGPSFAGEIRASSGQVHGNVKVSDHYPKSFISTGWFVITA